MTVPCAAAARTKVLTEQEFARGWRAFILVLVDCSKVRPGGGGRKRRKEREERERGKRKEKNASISLGGHAATQ